MKRRTKKFRGSRTCGYGRKRQHRGHGRSGGHGRAGHFKHKWTKVTSRKWPFPGKHGFTRHNKREKIVINLDEINKLIKEGMKEIDLTKLGYEKVLGRGQLKYTVVVKCYEFSKRALEKLGNLAVEVK